MKRSPVNKFKSAKSFRRTLSKTKAINLKGGSQRGGIRL